VKSKYACTRLPLSLSSLILTPFLIEELGLEVDCLTLWGVLRAFGQRGKHRRTRTKGTIASMPAAWRFVVRAQTIGDGTKIPSEKSQKEFRLGG